MSRSRPTTRHEVGTPAIAAVAVGAVGLVVILSRKASSGSPPPPPGTLGPPTNLHPVTIRQTSIDMAWDGVTGAVGYQPLLGSAKLSVVAGPSTTIFGLKPFTGYKITVATIDSAGGFSVPSAPVVVKTLPQVNLAPAQNLVASNISDSGFDLAWDPVVGASEYVPMVGSRALASSPATSAHISGLANGQSYTISVVARDAAGDSSQSSSITVTMALLQPPTGLAASNVLSTSFDLSWTPPTATTRSYNVLVKGRAVANVLTPSYHAAKLSPHTQYQMSVEAVDDSGKSAPSPSLAVLTGHPPLPPTGLAVTAVAPGGCTIAWAAETGASGYTPYDGTTPLGQVTAPGAVLAGLSSGAHLISVDSIDAGGGHSSPSAPVSVTIP